MDIALIEKRLTEWKNEYQEWSNTNMRAKRMRRREFIQQTALVSAATAALNFDAEAGVNWTIGRSRDTSRASARKIAAK